MVLSVFLPFLAFFYFKHDASLVMNIRCIFIVNILQFFLLSLFAVLIVLIVIVVIVVVIVVDIVIASVMVTAIEIVMLIALRMCLYLFIQMLYRTLAVRVIGFWDGMGQVGIYRNMRAAGPRWQAHDSWQAFAEAESSNTGLLTSHQRGPKYSRVNRSA